MTAKRKNLWYAEGLTFECVECGQCCAGPGEGFIWVSRKELQFIADFLKISIEQLCRNFIRRIRHGTTIIEHPQTKDCIFLRKIRSSKKCIIYPVRPTQCRTWPFWTTNLTDQNAWNAVVQRCKGINHGRRYCLDEIEKIRKMKKWWTDDNSPAAFAQNI